MDEKEKPETTFEKEMTRMMKLAILKLGDLEKEVRDNTQRIGSLESEVSNNTQILKTLSGQFNDVAVMALEDNKRITKLETEVAELQSNIH